MGICIGQWMKRLPEPWRSRSAAYEKGRGASYCNPVVRAAPRGAFYMTLFGGSLLSVTHGMACTGVCVSRTDGIIIIQRWLVGKKNPTPSLSPSTSSRESQTTAHILPPSLAVKAGRGNHGAGVAAGLRGKGKEARKPHIMRGWNSHRSVGTCVHMHAQVIQPWMVNNTKAPFQCKHPRSWTLNQICIQICKDTDLRKMRRKGGGGATCIEDERKRSSQTSFGVSAACCCSRPVRLSHLLPHVILFFFPWNLQKCFTSFSSGTSTKQQEPQMTFSGHGDPTCQRNLFSKTPPGSIP